MEPRVVLITGGARGIGASLARAHGRRGDEVVVADLDPTAPGQLRLDVRDRDASARVVEEVIATHGRIDVFHANAGIAVAGVHSELTPQHWDDLIDTDLRGVVHGVDAVYPHMRRQGHGHLVVMGSLAGVLPVPAMVPYSAVKAAVVTLGRALRVEARRYGVRVTVVCPAFVDTPLLDHINPGMRPTHANRVGLRLVRQVQGPPLDPDALAERVVRALPRNPELILAPRPLAPLAVLGERWAPGLTRRASRLALARYLSMTAEPGDDRG